MSFKRYKARYKVKRGVNRIALVFAIISVLPGFIFGWESTYKTYMTRNPVYVEWKELDGQWEEYLPYNKNKFSDSNIKKTHQIGIGSDAPSMYLYPVQKCLITGIISASLFYAVVFFSIHGIGRSIIWITRVFKDTLKRRRGNKTEA